MSSLYAYMRSIWSLDGWVRFRDIKNDIFLIIFEKETDKKRVLEGGPWLFSKSILLVKHIDGTVPRHGNVLEMASFWVHLFGIPSLGFTTQMGKRIGSRIGRVKEVDEKRQVSWRGGTRGMPYMRVKVELNVMQKLPRGIFVSDGKEGKSWVSFRFERLPNFCFFCGVIGHVMRECSEEGATGGGRCQYGEWLRADSDTKSPFDDRKKGGASRPPTDTPPSNPTEINQELTTTLGEGRDKANAEFEGSDNGGKCGSKDWVNCISIPTNLMSWFSKSVMEGGKSACTINVRPAGTKKGGLDPIVHVGFQEMDMCREETIEEDHLERGRVGTVMVGPNEGEIKEPMSISNNGDDPILSSLRGGRKKCFRRAQGTRATGKGQGGYLRVKEN